MKLLTAMGCAGCGWLAACGAAPVPADAPADAPPVIVSPSEPLSSEEDAPVAAPTQDWSKQPQFGYAPLWSASDSGGWNHALAIAPSGDVISLSSHHLAVLARPDGSQRDSVRVCDGIALRHTSLFFRDDKSAIVVCRDAIVEVDMATMQKKVGVKLPWTSLSDDAESCSHTAGRIAVGNRTGQVVEYDVASYKQLARHDFGADHRVDALAYSPDGQRLAVSLAPHEIRNDGQILILEGSTRRRVPNFTDDSGALAFSPEGRELFARTRSFTAARGALADGTLSGSVKISSWLSAAMYLDDSLIAATGAHGLGLLHPAHAEMIELHGRAGEGLAASADRQLLCAGTRDGTIHCWARGGERATIAAQPTPAKPSAAPTTPTTAAIEGSIVSRAGTTLTLALDGSTLKVGDGLRLDKRVESKLGGMSITAWLSIADVRVQTADAKRVTVVIEAEKSSVTLNGQPLDHFTAGSTVKLMPR